MNKFNEKTKLSFINYFQMDNWSIRYLKNHNFNYDEKYKLYKIGDFLTRNKEIIEIEDDKEYKRVTIKLYNKGVYIRDTEFGKNIGVKKQYKVKEGQFILSKIDARNGAFGIVPPELEGAITTADFLSYNIDTSKINPEFLSLLTTTKEFLNYCQNSSSGTTGRQRINEKSFLEITIPIPSIDKQNKIVIKYNEKINLAYKQEKKAKELEESIDKYWVEELGIENIGIIGHKKGLAFVNFNELVRWELKDKATLNSVKYSKNILKDVIKEKPQYGANVKGVKRMSETRYIRITDINENGSLNQEFVSPEFVEEKFLLKENDFLIARSGNTVGKTFLYKEKHGRAIYAGYLVKYKIEVKKIIPEYLLYFTKSKFYKNWIYSNQRISGQPNINGQEFLNSPIIIPPLIIQKNIVNRINTDRINIESLLNKAEFNRKTAIEEFEKEIFQDEN